MHLDFEWGTGMMGAELPDTTDVFVTGETVKDPECLPQDWDSLYNATLESIRNPIGMEPLADLAHPGAKAVIVIPDIVKGGTQPTSPPQGGHPAPASTSSSPTASPTDDVLLLFSNGLHPRTSTAEAKLILGEDLYNEFEGTGQITSHDSEDYDHLVGPRLHRRRATHVIMNKYVYGRRHRHPHRPHAGQPLRRLLRRLQALRHPASPTGAPSARTTCRAS